MGGRRRRRREKGEAGSPAPPSHAALTGPRALHVSTVLVSFSKDATKCIFLVGIDFIVFLPPLPGTHPHLIPRCFPLQMDRRDLGL